MLLAQLPPTAVQMAQDRASKLLQDAGQVRSLGLFYSSNSSYNSNSSDRNIGHTRNNSNSSNSSNIIHSNYRNSRTITVIVATFIGRAWEFALRMTELDQGPYFATATQRVHAASLGFRESIV